MRSRFLARLFLAAAFLVATQVALEHPLEHLSQSSAPAHQQHCDACVAFASIGAAAVSHAPLAIDVPAADFSTAAPATTFTAAFTPHFRSQAPPELL
jgi:hypothetical protein